MNLHLGRVADALPGSIRTADPEGAGAMFAFWISFDCTTAQDETRH